MSDWRPDEERLFRNRYARWGRRWGLFGLLSVVGGIALGVTVSEVAGALVGAFGATFGLIFGMAFWFTGRGAQAQLDAIRGGAYLARWSVDRDRWMAWYDERESKLMLGAALGVGLLMLGGLLTAGLMWEDGDVEAARWTAIITVLAAPVVGLVIRAHRAPPPRPSMRSVPMIIGPDGVLTVGAYLQWRGFGVALTASEVRDDPPTLVVHYIVSTNHGTAEHEMPLPVPPDRLDEARRIAEVLRPLT